MVLVPGLLPPSRANWQLINGLWQYFPIVTGIQWLVDFYPQGKTSIESRFNLPGKWAWALMEAPGFVTLLYNMYTLPKELGLGPLPWANWTMAGLYVPDRSPLLPVPSIADTLPRRSTTSTAPSSRRSCSTRPCRPSTPWSSSRLWPSTSQTRSASPDGLQDTGPPLPMTGPVASTGSKPV